MEWNCAHCSSQCLREMEDSICVFVISQGGGQSLLEEV